MTEAKTDYLTPQIVVCPTGLEQQAEIEKLIFGSFPETQPQQLSLVNSEMGNLGIDQVRTLTQDLSFASFGGKLRHILVLAVDHASKEAQNALLKLLEEPPAKTQIWLGVTQSNSLLPTLRSRCLEIRLKSETADTADSSETKNLATQIPSLSHRALVDLAEKYKDRQAAQALVNQLILYFHEQLETEALTVTQQVIEQLLETQTYLEANVNVKLTLEDCFFSLKAKLTSSNVH